MCFTQIAVVKADQEQRGNTPYLTSTKGVAPPLVSTTFPVVDQGKPFLFSSVFFSSLSVDNNLLHVHGNCYPSVYREL